MYILTDITVCSNEMCISAKIEDAAFTQSHGGYSLATEQHNSIL